MGDRQPARTFSPLTVFLATRHSLSAMAWYWTRVFRSFVARGAELGSSSISFPLGTAHTLAHTQTSPLGPGAAPGVTETDARSRRPTLTAGRRAPPAQRPLKGRPTADGGSQWQRGRLAAAANGEAARPLESARGGRAAGRGGTERWRVVTSWRPQGACPLAVAEREGALIGRGERGFPSGSCPSAHVGARPVAARPLYNLLTGLGAGPPSQGGP